MRGYIAIETRVEHGSDSLAPGRTVEVSLQKLVFVCQVSGESIRFFYQSTHHSNLAAIERLVGIASKGALYLLARCYHEKWERDVCGKYA